MFFFFACKPSPLDIPSPNHGGLGRQRGWHFSGRSAWLRCDNRRRWQRRCSRACAEWPRQRVTHRPALKPKASTDGPRQRQGRQWTIVCSGRWLWCAGKRRGEATEEIPPAPVGSRDGGSTGGGRLLDSGHALLGGSTRVSRGGCTRVSRGGCTRVDRGLDPKRQFPDRAAARAVRRAAARRARRRPWRR